MKLLQTENKHLRRKNISGETTREENNQHQLRMREFLHQTTATGDGKRTQEDGNVEKQQELQRY